MANEPPKLSELELARRQAEILLLACVIVSGLAAPAFARNYYIVQNPKTLKCSVLPKKPKGKTVALVSGSSSYNSRNEARAALRAASPCKKHLQ
jgi:hypothetical protein